MNTELSQSFFCSFIPCSFLRAPPSVTDAFPIHHGSNDLPREVNSCHMKRWALETPTQTGVVLVPSPALSVYVHSTSFDFCCRH